MGNILQVLNSEGEREKIMQQVSDAKPLGCSLPWDTWKEGRISKKSEKLIQAYCKTLEERQRETDSQLRRKLCSEGVTHTFTLSWDLFQNLIPLYLNEEMNCTQLCFQCSFLVPPFLLSRDPSCYLSKSSEWQRMREGSGKTTEGRRKRDGLWLREGIGRKRKSEYSLKVVDPCRN